MTYFDTSVIVAYYAPERISEKAERRLRRAKSIVICPLVEAELVSAIARKVRDKELSTIDARKIVAKFNSHMNDGLYTVNPLERKHFSIAAELIGQFTTPLRTLDLLHVAVAFDLSAPLVTADKQLFRACKSLSITAEIVE
jgi:predicted nucleic acid-binding protein